MLPTAAALTDVLPTERLGPTGRPVGALREDLYGIPDAANALHVIGLWVQSVGVLALADWWGNPIGWVAAFVLMGRAFARFAILGHEAAHRLLFTNKAVNDAVGKWLVAYPAFVAIDAANAADPNLLDGRPLALVQGERAQPGGWTVPPVEA